MRQGILPVEDPRRAQDPAPRRVASQVPRVQPKFQPAFQPKNPSPDAHRPQALRMWLLWEGVPSELRPSSPRPHPRRRGRAPRSPRRARTPRTSTRKRSRGSAHRRPVGGQSPTAGVSRKFQIANPAAGLPELNEMPSRLCRVYHAPLRPSAQTPNPFRLAS